MSTLGTIVLIAFVAHGSTAVTPPYKAQETHMTSNDTMATSDSDADIRAIIADQAQAWNRHDAAAWASRFEPTAEFINILGAPFSGQRAIEGVTARIFSTIFKDSRDSVTVQKIVLVSPDLAIVHYEHAVSGYTALPPGIQASEPGADGKGVLRTRMVYVLRRGAHAKWMIVNGQNTAIMPGPWKP